MTVDQLIEQLEALKALHGEWVGDLDTSVRDVRMSARLDRVRVMGR